MEEFLQHAKSRLDRGKHLEKVHTVIGNKCCDLDSIISTLTYAYYLGKITPPSVLCLPVLNVTRVEFDFYSETRFILEELDIPESYLIFRDEINLQRLNDEDRLSVTLVNFDTLTSEDECLAASVVKIINPEKTFDSDPEFCESSSAFVAKEILEEAPELLTRQLAHLLRGSILFCCLSAEHEGIPAQQEKVLNILERKFPELPPRQNIISSLQDTKFHTQGSSVEDIILKEFKELSDGDIKVAITTMHMSLEDLMSYRNIIDDLKIFLDKYEFDILILLAIYTSGEQNVTRQQIAVYSENPELCNQVCCELEECQNPFLDLEPSDYGYDQFFVYQQESPLVTCDQVAAIIKEAINRRRIGMVPNSRTSSTEAVAGSAPLSQGSSGIMELYGSDVDPQPNQVNFQENQQDINGSAQAQVDANVDLVSPDSGLATIRSSRSSKESSVFLSDDSPVAEVSGAHHSFVPGIDSYSPIPECVIIEEETSSSRNDSDNLDLFSFDLIPNIRSESSSHSADYSMADDFFFQSDSSEGQQPISQKEHNQTHFYGDDMVNCSSTLLKTKGENSLLVEVENVSLVEFDDNFMHSPENHEDLCRKNTSVSDFVEFDSPLSSEGPGNREVKIPPTPMNSLVESSPLDNGPPTFFPEDVIEKINEIGTTDKSQAKYAYWWNVGEPVLTQEALLNADTWSSSEQESVFHSPDLKSKSNSENKSAAASFQIAGPSSHRLETRGNQNTRQESNTFSDLWNSNPSLQVTSDPWSGSPDRQCAGHTWNTIHGNSPGRYFTQANDVVDQSSGNGFDIDKDNALEQSILEENHYIQKTSETQDSKLKDIGENVDLSTDLKHIQRNLCVWNLYEHNEEQNAIDAPADWEDPFLSYRCLDFTNPSTSKESIVSPPDTNYSTSDSVSSPIYEDDIKEIDKNVEENESSDLDDTQLFVNNNLVKSTDTGFSDPENKDDCTESEEASGMVNIDETNITIERSGKRNNQNPYSYSWHEYSPEYREDISLIQSRNDLSNEVSDCLDHLSITGEDNTFANNDSDDLYQSNLLACNSLCSPSSTLSDDVLHNYENVMDDKIPVKLQNIQSFSPDKAKKISNVFTELQHKANSDQLQINYTQEDYDGHDINIEGESEDTRESYFQYDTESSSLNTPDGLESDSTSNVQNVNIQNKSPVSSMRSIDKEYDVTVDCVIRLSPVNDTRYQINEDSSNLTQNSCSLSQDTNNTYKEPELMLSGRECLNKKIQIKENFLCSGASATTNCDTTNVSFEDDILSDDVLNNSHNTVVPDDQGSELLSGHLDKLEINLCGEEIFLSGSSHSSSTSPDLADSWPISQDGIGCTDTDLKNNDQHYSFSQFDNKTDEGKSTGKTLHNTISKVPMNLDIWNTQICEDLESSSSSPESNDILEDSSSPDKNAKNCFQQKLLDLETSECTLFNKSHSSSTTPGTEEESLEDQLDCVHDYPSAEYNILDEDNCISHTESHQKSTLNELNEYSLPHLICYKENKTEAKNNATDTSRDRREKSLESGDNDDENAMSYTLDYAIRKNQEETLESSYIESHANELPNTKPYKTSFPVTGCENTMKIVSSDEELETSSHCCENIPVIQNPFNSPENNDTSEETPNLSQSIPLVNCHLNNHLDDLDIQVFEEECSVVQHTFAEIDDLCALPCNMDVKTESEHFVMKDTSDYKSNVSVNEDEFSSDCPAQYNATIGEGLTAGPFHSEYIPDLLDDHTQQFSPFLCVEPDLWNMTEKNCNKVSMSDSPDVLNSCDNSSNSSNSPDLCREYVNIEPYHHHSNMSTDYDDKMRVHSNITNERRSNTCEGDYMTALCTENDLQYFNNIQKSNSLSIYKNISDPEILSDVHHNDHDKSVFPLKYNGDFLPGHVSVATENYESPISVFPEHNTYIEGTEICEQNIPMQTSERGSEDAAILEKPLLKSVVRETQFSVEDTCYNQYSPAGGNDGPCNEPDEHNGVWKNDIREESAVVDYSKDTDIRWMSGQTVPDGVYSVDCPNTFQSISMKYDGQEQTIHVSRFHSFNLEEESSFIIPQRPDTKKKSEEISEHEHSWSIILSQTEASESSPEDIFGRTETGDCDKDLEEMLYDRYEQQNAYPKPIRGSECIDLEESFELCKLEETDTKADTATANCLTSLEDGVQLQLPPSGGACEKQSCADRMVDQRSVILDDVEMDVPYDGAEFRPEPPNSLDLNGSHARKIKLTAPNINLSLDQSEGSILSDDNLDTPDELDINVDDLDTPDEADSFDYTGNDERPALGHSVQDDLESIREYTAEEERADNRLWRTVIIGEQEQRINMKVIEPYTKVISHGGYYGEGINAIIVFAACFLPDSSRADYNYIMENLFLYVISTLELMVAEDYMIVYLNGATPRRKMPGLGWMKKCYQMIDRRLRKNLKSFIIVHPSWFIRTILAVTRPFISSKFSSKIRYVSTLSELSELIPMEYVQIPESIVKYEEARCFPRKMRLDEELKDNEAPKAGCLPMEPEMTSLDQEFEKKNEDNV